MYAESHPRQFISTSPRDLSGLSVSAFPGFFSGGFPNLQLSTFDSQPFRSSKFFPLISFTDPHPLSLLESYRFKNSGGEGVSQSLLPRQDFTRISPLTATLIKPPVSIANKRLTAQPDLT